MRKRIITPNPATILIRHAEQIQEIRNDLTDLAAMMTNIIDLFSMLQLVQADRATVRAAVAARVAKN